VNRTNQSTVIKEAINSYVPRPTVRRVARDLRNELLQKISILQSEALKPSEPSQEKD